MCACWRALAGRTSPHCACPWHSNRLHAHLRVARSKVRHLTRTGLLKNCHNPSVGSPSTGSDRDIVHAVEMVTGAVQIADPRLPFGFGTDSGFGKGDLQEPSAQPSRPVRIVGCFSPCQPGTRTPVSVVHRPYKTFQMQIQVCQVWAEPEDQ